MTTFQINDRVKYSDRFIQSIQGHDIADDRGVVTEVIPALKKGGSTIPARVRVKWQDGEIRTGLASNLSKAR